jgi:hypothetical protein
MIAAVMTNTHNSSPIASGIRQIMNTSNVSATFTTSAGSTGRVSFHIRAFITFNLRSIGNRTPPADRNPPRTTTAASSSSNKS